MNAQNPSLSPRLLAAVETLAVNLRQSEPLARYHLALDFLEADPEAQALLQRLSELQAQVRAGQAQGRITPDHIDPLRAAQRAAQANPVIRDYARTQQASLAYLREINQEISQLLGVDFAALAKRPGCC